MQPAEMKAVKRAVDLVTEVIGQLQQGRFQTDRSGLVVMLHTLTGYLAGLAAVSPDVRKRLQATLADCQRGQASPAWQAATLADLGDIRDALMAAMLAGAGDPFAAYRGTRGVDLNQSQSADRFDSILGGTDAGLPRSPESSDSTRRPGRAGAIADIAPDEAGPARHAEPPRAPEARMKGIPAAEAKPVRLGAAAPAACRPGDEFTARFVAYPPGDEAEVDALLRKLSPRATSQLGLQSCLWQAGTPVRVALSGKGLAIDPPTQDFVWQGERVLLNFDVTVPDTTPEGVVVLKFDAAIDGIIVARLRMDLDIRADAVAGEPNRIAAEAARTAFASYSSQDRQRVLDRVAALQISAGMDIFLDCLSLHPGQHWEARLAEEIRRRELFLLFWSQPAAHSQWVEWEWRRALAEGKKGVMEIHPLENGVLPPPELGDLHFADPAMAVRAASGPPP